MAIVSGISDIGSKRTTNQDYIYISDNDSLPLYIVADGMGGYKGGEIASELAVKSVVYFFNEEKERIKNIYELNKLTKDAIKIANNSVFNKSKEYIDCKNMGTTITLVYIYDNHVSIGHVGDSRAYYIDKEQSKIIQLTEDDSLVNELLKRGEISKKEALSHPKKNLITNAVGVDKKIKCQVLNYKVKKGEGDYILLCSDGLTNSILDDKILEIVNKYDGVRNISYQLIKEAKKVDGKDNISVILIEL